MKLMITTALATTLIAASAFAGDTQASRGEGNVTGGELAAQTDVNGNPILDSDDASRGDDAVRGPDVAAEIGTSSDEKADGDFAASRGEGNVTGEELSTGGAAAEVGAEAEVSSTSADYQASRGEANDTGAELATGGALQSDGTLVVDEKEDNLVRDRGTADDGVTVETVFDDDVSDEVKQANPVIK